MKIKFILMLLLCISFVHATQLKVNIKEDTLTYFPVDDLRPYLSYSGASTVLNDTQLRVYSGELVEDYPVLESGDVIVSNAVNVNKLEIVKKGTIIRTVFVDYCDFDGVCEACTESSCDVSENAIFCADCREENDHLCEPNKNLICDNDCVTYYDPDCDTFDTNEVALDNTCIELQGNQCEQNEQCKGFHVATKDSDQCCLGSCEMDTLDLSDKPNYILLLVVLIIALFLVLVVFRYFKYGKMLILLVIIGGSILIFISPNDSPTGFATKEDIITTHTEIFLPTYSTQQKNNLYEALLRITQEFEDRSVVMTPELLAAVITTLRKEVGSTFGPIEEYGDYGMGPGCSYKIGGLCRSSPYDGDRNGDGLGGADYKGRGYIQITHRYNYLRHCGADCVALIEPSRNLCGCNNNAHCTVTDESQCPMIRAMRPDYASRIFASYYESRNLVEQSNLKRYYAVGLGINGGATYAQQFSEIANGIFIILQSDPTKTNNLINHFLENDVPPPEPGPEPLPDPGGEDPPIDFRDLPGFGLYYIPTTHQYQYPVDLQAVETIYDDVRDFVENVRQCSAQTAPRICSPPSITCSDGSTITCDQYQVVYCPVYDVSTCIEFHHPPDWDTDYCSFMLTREQNDCINVDRYPQGNSCKTCEPFIGSVVCDDYENQDICNADPCQLDCFWSDDSCVKNNFGSGFDSRTFNYCVDSAEHIYVDNGGYDLYSIPLRFALRFS